LPKPKYEEAQQVYVPYSVHVSIEDSKKEAFKAQIINDCYGLGVANKMIPEETPSTNLELFLFVLDILHDVLKKKKVIPRYDRSKSSHQLAGVVSFVDDITVVI
jgi:hypothetical protein